MGVKVRAAGALATALRGLVGAEIKQVDELDGHTRILIDAIGRPYELRALWVGNGWPSEVREALIRWAQPLPSNLVFTAKRFSPGALRILEEEGANWADQAGQARIVLPPGLLIMRESALKKNEESPQAVRWPRSATEIAEFILHKGITGLHTGKLAEETGWSAAQVSKVLKRFDELGWTEQRGGKSGRATRRELVAPGPLLDSWAQHVGNERHRKRLGHATSKDLLRFAHMELWERLGRGRQDWALTTWAGLEMTTPFATTVPALHVYILARRFNTEIDEVMRATGIRRVEEGARIEFWEADFRILVQRGEPSGIPVISRPRLYADLLALGGRGVDSAQHYRETALGI